MPPSIALSPRRGAGRRVGREVEVEEHRVAVAGDQDVRRLEVAVEQASRVGVIEPLGEPGDDPDRRPGCCLPRRNWRAGWSSSLHRSYGAGAAFDRDATRGSCLDKALGRTADGVARIPAPAPRPGPRAAPAGSPVPRTGNTSFGQAWSRLPTTSSASTSLGRSPRGLIWCAGGLEHLGEVGAPQVRHAHQPKLGTRPGPSRSARYGCAGAGPAGAALPLRTATP